MQDRDFKGIWISKEIWLNTKLSALDKVILAEIDSLDNEEHCTASNEYFAKFCDCSVPTVTRSIQKLIDNGYIEKVSFDGRHRVIKMIKQTNQNDYADSSKFSSNNIYNNIDSKGYSSKDEYIIENAPDLNENSHEITKDDFIGSGRKKKTSISKPRQTLKDKCIDSIYQFTNNTGLQLLLERYLDMRLAMKDKPIYGVAQWDAILGKLSTFDDQMKVVQISTEKGWASFYEPNNFNTNNNNNTKFSQGDNMSCEKNDTTPEERAERLRKQGKQESF